MIFLFSKLGSENVVAPRAKNVTFSHQERKQKLYLERCYIEEYFKVRKFSPYVLMHVSTRLHPHYTVGIWKWRFHSKIALIVFRRSALHPGKLKMQLSPVILHFCLSKTRGQVNHMILVTPSFWKSSVFKLCSVDRKTQSRRFQTWLLRFSEKRFRKASFSWRIIVNGKPNRSKISNFSGVVWTLPYNCPQTHFRRDVFAEDTFSFPVSLLKSFGRLQNGNRIRLPAMSMQFENQIRNLTAGVKHICHIFVWRWNVSRFFLPSVLAIQIISFLSCLILLILD